MGNLKIKAIKLSAILHFLLITSSAVLSRNTAPVTHPILIDFTIKTAEAITAEISERGSSWREQMGQASAQPTASPPAAVHEINKSYRAPGYTLHNRHLKKTLKQESESIDQRAVGYTAQEVREAPQEPAAAPASSTALTSVEPPVGAGENKTGIQTISPAAGGSGNQAQNGIPSDNGGDDTNDRGEGEQYLRTNFNYIRDLIMQNLSFPAAARKLGWTGEMVVSFHIRQDGGVEEITLVSSSGHEALDNNVIAAIRRTAPFPAPPVRARIILPIAYRLKSP